MKKKSKKKFPDLTGDGKVTRADILKGRGVIESEHFVDEVMTRFEIKDFWHGVSNNSTLYESELDVLDHILGGLKPLSESFAMDDLPLLAENTDLLEEELIQQKVEMISLEEFGEIFNLQLESEGYYDRLTDKEIDSLLGEMLINWNNGDGFRTDEGVENDVYSFLNEEQLNEFLSKLFGGGKKFNRGDFRRKMKAKKRTMDGIARRFGKTPDSAGAKRYRKQKADRFEAAGGKVVRGDQSGGGSTSNGGQSGGESTPKAGRSYGDGKEADGVKAKINSKGKPVNYVSDDEKKRRLDRVKASKLKRQTDLKAGRGFQASERGTAKLAQGRGTGDAAALARDKKGIQQRAGEKVALGDRKKADKNKGAFAGRLTPAQKRAARATRGAVPVRQVDNSSTQIVRGARMGLAERVLEELLETFQDLNMKRRKKRIQKVLKGREKQEKDARPGTLGKLLGKKRSFEKFSKAYDKKKALIDKRGKDGEKDQAEKDRRGGGMYTKGGRKTGQKITKEIEQNRKRYGEPISKDSDVYEDDLPQASRHLRRQKKAADAVEARKAAKEKRAK